MIQEILQFQEGWEVHFTPTIEGEETSSDQLKPKLVSQAIFLQSMREASIALVLVLLKRTEGEKIVPKAKQKY